MTFAQRDALVADFRRRVAKANGILPLTHQAEWRLASEGWSLQPHAPLPGGTYEDVLIPAIDCPKAAMVVGTRTIRDIPCAIVRRAITPRPGGAAHIIADLAAFKAGKSFYSALWAAGFAILGAECHLDFIGFEYSTSEPEFQYLIDFLCGDGGMRMRYRTLHQDSAHGRMKLTLANGAEFVCKSWERKEGLKGKKRIAYVYTEAYQLPGLEVYTSLSQNLRELRGQALFPTTPDRPWVGVFHDYAHGHDPDWHCTCCVDAKENPFTFDQKARDRDDPELGGIMTRERFAIAWKGQLGRFIGKVYTFAKGNPEWHFTPERHPLLWDPKFLVDHEARATVPSTPLGTEETLP